MKNILKALGLTILLVGLVIGLCVFLNYYPIVAFYILGMVVFSAVFAGMYHIIKDNP